MNLRQIAASTLVVALALGCGKVRDDAGDTSHTDGDGGNGASGDPDGGARSGSNGTQSGGRNGVGSSGAGGGNAGTGGGTGPGSGSGAAANSGGETGSGGITSSGGTTSTGGNLNTGGAVVEEEGTKAMRAGSTVWIGQAEIAVTYPEDFNGDRKPQKIVLILDRVATGVTGTITFGEGPPPPTPEDPGPTYPPVAPGDEDYGYDTNWSFSPHNGFTYSIVSSELRGNTLILAFVPLELFETWCTLQSTNPDVRYLDEPCACVDGECHSASGPTRRLELVVSGNTLSGQLSRPPGNFLGETPALKLAHIR